MVPTKNMDMYCSHYIMPNAPVDYSPPNLSMWDSFQVSSNVTNGITNAKKVKLSTRLITDTSITYLCIPTKIDLCYSNVRSLKHWRCYCSAEWKS